VSTALAPARARRAANTWVGLWSGWLASRAVTLLLLFPERKVFGDVRYYLGSVDSMFHGGSIHEVLQEYPVPAVVVLLGLRLLSGPYLHVYYALFVLLMLAVDGAFSQVLFQAARWRWLPGVTLWVVAMPLLGPMLLCRFDLLPAALAGGALLAAGRRPVTSGALAGLGALVKLWPAALLPSLWLADRRPKLLTSFGAVVVGVVAVVAAVSGLDRLTSPLHWQGERGLQVEAYAALPLLVADLFRPDRWQVEYTRYYAFQVYGPGVDAAMTAATLAAVLAVAVLAVLWLRGLRRRGPEVAGLLAVLTVILFVITDKTFSPQYLIWVAALVAVVGVTRPAAVPWPVVPLLLATCGITHLIFPLFYDELVAGRPYAVLLLVARDAGLVAVGALVGRRVWALTRPAREPA
jgi:Glycosyltransferase family 87